MVSRDYFVQHRLSGLRRPKTGIAALENQPERCAAVCLFSLGQVLMPGQRTPEHPEPSRVVPRPVDPLQRHAHDLRTPAARAAPQDRFDRLTRERAGLEMRVELALEYPARQLHVAQIPDGRSVNPTPVL